MDVVRAIDTVFDRPVVLERRRDAPADHAVVRLGEPWTDIDVLGWWTERDRCVSVEADVGQRHVPEAMTGDVAYALIHAATALVGELHARGIDCSRLSLDSIRVLPGGSCTVVAPAVRATSADGGVPVALRRIVDETAAAAEGGLDLEPLHVACASHDPVQALRAATGTVLRGIGVEPRLIAARLDAQASSQEALPQVDQGSTRPADLPGRWDDLELDARTWRPPGARLLIAAPVLLVLAVFVVAVIAADRRNDASPSIASPVERMHAIAQDTSKPLQRTSHALESWDGDAAGLRELRAAGDELGDAASAGLEDASKLALSSVSEAEAHAALRGMLAGQQALGNALRDLPTSPREVEATAFQDALLRARVVSGDFIGLGVALGSLGQQALDDDGYGGLPDAAEHGLDVAIELEGDRFAGSQQARQRRLQRELQERLLEAMEQEQALAQERLDSMRDSAAADFGNVQDDVLKRMEAAFDLRFAELSKRATALEQGAGRSRDRVTRGCGAAELEALQANVLARQQLVLELNTTAAPTEAGLEQQVELVQRLGRGIRADQALLQQGSTMPAAGSAQLSDGMAAPTAAGAAAQCS